MRISFGGAAQELLLDGDTQAGRGGPGTGNAAGSHFWQCPGADG